MRFVVMGIGIGTKAGGGLKMVDAGMGLGRTGCAGTGGSSQ